MSDLVSEDTKIDKDGAVTGTLLYNIDVTAFDEGEQEGHYFILMLNDKYRDKEVTVKRDGVERGKATDLEWLLYVPSTSTTFTFETTEDGVFLTLTFKGATLKPNTIRMASANTVRRKKTGS